MQTITQLLSPPVLLGHKSTSILTNFARRIEIQTLKIHHSSHNTTNKNQKYFIFVLPIDMNFNFDNNMFGSNPNFHGNGDFIVFGGKNVCTAQSCNCYICQRRQVINTQRVRDDARLARALSEDGEAFCTRDMRRTSWTRWHLRQQEREDAKVARDLFIAQQARLEEEAQEREAERQRRLVEEADALMAQHLQMEFDRQRQQTMEEHEALRRRKVEEDADQQMQRCRNCYHSRCRCAVYNFASFNDDDDYY